MFSHVMVGANDIEASKKFYGAVLGTLGIGPGVANNNRYFYRSPTGSFPITKPIDGDAACHANGGTIGFLAQTPEQGEALHAAGENFFRWLVTDRPQNLITGPLIYGMEIPLLMLDACVSFYQWACFPIYGITKVRRSD